MNSNFEINASLELFDYLAMVNEIALEFFSEEGTYQPHIGKVNAMRLFLLLATKFLLMRIWTHHMDIQLARNHL